VGPVQVIITILSTYASFRVAGRALNQERR